MAGLIWDYKVMHDSRCPCSFRLPPIIEVSVVGLLTWWLRAPVYKQTLGIPKGLSFFDLKSNIVCRFKGSSHGSSFSIREIAKYLQLCFKITTFPSWGLLTLIKVKDPFSGALLGNSTSLVWNSLSDV